MQRSEQLPCRDRLSLHSLILVYSGKWLKSRYSFGVYLDVLYMLGVQYASVGDTVEAVNCLRKAELAAPDKDMREKVNHMVQSLTFR